MEELCYTSIAQGLDRGKTGFTVAGKTSTMSKTLSEQAEKLSGFDPLLDPNNPMAYAGEPVQYSHLVLKLSGGKSHIVTRRGACPPDYTGRSNFLAHHAVLSEAEAMACRGGPAALAGSDGFLMTQWQGDARPLPNRTPPAIIDRGPTSAAVEAAGLEAGWAASLADRLRDPGVRQTWLIYSPDMNILGIVADTLSHLEPTHRWATTFATHATRSFPGPGAECRLQCIVAGTEYARDTLARRGADVFDLTARGPAPARRMQPPAAQPAGRAAAASRGGFIPAAAAAARIAPAAVEPSPVGHEQSQLAFPTPQNPTSSQRHQERRTGYGLAWVAIPAALAVAMTLTSALAGYQWLTAVRQADDLREEIRTLKKEHKTALEQQRQTLTATTKETPRANDGESTDTAASQGPEPDASKMATPAATKQEGQPPAATGAEEDDAERKPRVVADIASTQTTPVISPTIIADVRDALEQKKPGSKVTLLTKITTPPAKNAISLSPADAAQELLDATVKSTLKETTLSVLKKQVAKIKFDEKDQTLVLDITDDSKETFLLKYLTLRIDHGTDGAIVIPLGRPVDARLFIRESAQGDRDQQEKGRKQQIGQSFQLFGDTPAEQDAAKQLHLLLACDRLRDRKLLEHFEVEGGDVTTHLKEKTRNPPDNTFTFYTTGTAGKTIGVQFERAHPLPPGNLSPPTYKVRGYYCELVSGGLVQALNEYREHEAFDNKVFDEISRITTNAIKTFNPDKETDNTKKKEMQEKKARALELSKVDEQSWEEATKHYPKQRLENRPFRLTLKPKGSEKGIVVVDSLSGKSPETADPPQEKNR